MRKRAHERDGYSDKEEEQPIRKEMKVERSSEVSVTMERGHINFFADIKQGVGHKELCTMFMEMQLHVIHMPCMDTS